MSGRSRKKGHGVSKKPLSSLVSRFYEDSSGVSVDSKESSDSDWMEEQKQKSGGKLWSRTQDFAEEPGQNRRNFGSKSKGIRATGNKETPESEPRQCYWIHCLNAARSGSKYCSDECGVKLATHRILTVLPERVKEWNSSPSVATKNNQKELEEIKEIIKKSSQHFDELEEKRQALDRFIETVSKIPYDPTKHSGDGGTSEDGFVWCVICGHEINVKNFRKHVERCFNRTEKNIAFESRIPPSIIPGTKIFCDIFNKKSGTFCKRLASNCPDHCKNLHSARNTICGAPLDFNGQKDELKLENICRALKSNCQRHFNWEKLYRADIDIQKVSTWTKLNGLALQKNDIDAQIYNRGGVLHLLLNSTKVEDNGSNPSNEEINLEI